MLPVQAPAETIEARGISKFFGELSALHKVSITVRPGDSVLLYGANGAGKTSLLRTLAGLARPAEGEVLFGGRSFTENISAVRSRIGFVSHATFLYGELTGRENARLFGKLFGVPNLEDRIDQSLDLFAVRHRADEPVRYLSRGLQQRVSLARAFLHDPAFLFLDEPFTGLDADSASNLEQLLARLPEQGKALVFSTHDYEQGASIARRIVVLEKGQVKYDGAAATLPADTAASARTSSR